MNFHDEITLLNSQKSLEDVSSCNVYFYFLVTFYFLQSGLSLTTRYISRYKGDCNLLLYPSFAALVFTFFSLRSLAVSCANACLRDSLCIRKTPNRVFSSRTRITPSELWQRIYSRAARSHLLSVLQYIHIARVLLTS